MPGTQLQKKNEPTEDVDAKERHRKRSGKRFDPIVAFKIFCVWMRCGRNATQTAHITGHSERAVKSLVAKGRPRLGIKPFAEMAEELSPYARNAIFPEAVEEFIRAIWELEWSEEKIVRTVMLATWLMQVTAADTFANTKGLTDQPEKTIDLARSTLDVLEKCANIEERYMKRAKKLGMKFGDGSGGTQEDLSNLTAEELRRRIAEEKRATRVVEAKAVEEKK